MAGNIGLAVKTAVHHSILVRFLQHTVTVLAESRERMMQVSLAPETGRSHRGEDSSVVGD